MYGISPARLEQLKSMVRGLVSRGRKKTSAGQGAVVGLRPHKNSHQAHTAKRAAKRK